ncbi:formate dehydrogenase subunit alpha [Anaerolineae bacterium CFX7]|nr:formate dehydrogenase subunit alpha [Anaerolineae bacterium CFX7]
MLSSEKIIPTTCPFCGVGCRLDLHLRGNQISHVTTPYDDLTSKGNLCVKGRYGWDFVYHHDRVLTPLIRKDFDAGTATRRRAPARRDDWREASWDEALDVVTTRFAEIVEKHGPDSAAVFCCAKATNEDNYALQKLFRAVIGTNNIDHCTRLCHAGSVVALQMAVGSSAMSNSGSDIYACDVAIVTGSNTAESHPIIALQFKDAVMRHDTKLIIVDPRRVEMVNFAALWLQQRPGTDVPLFSAMANVIIQENLCNNAFLDARTENFETFAKAMQDFTPEMAERISGVPAEKIIRAARMYATAKNGAIYWSLGIPEHTHGTENALALVHLALLTGHIGRRGTGLNPLRGQNNVQGASDAGAMPWHYPGYQESNDPRTVEKFRAKWGHTPPVGRGLTTTEIADAWGTGAVKAQYVMGENPLMSEPNLRHAHHAIEHLEFLVCQDVFINETGRYADVILPSATFAEKDGTYTNTDRRVQRVRKAFEPLGQARADWEIISAVATRLEQKLKRPRTAYWAYKHPSEIWDEMRELVPAIAGISYERLETERLQWPVPTLDSPGTPFLFGETFPRGRAKFFPLVYQPSVEEPDEKYPYALTTGRVLYQWHGGALTRRSNLDFAAPEAFVEINPSDAPRIPCENGSPVRVSSRRGNVVLRARVTEKAAPGVVFVPFHYAEAAANTLTIDALDPQAKIPEYKICAVKIEPATLRELQDALPLDLIPTLAPSAPRAEPMRESF